MRHLWRKSSATLLLTLALTGLASLVTAPANAAAIEPTAPAGSTSRDVAQPIVGINSVDPEFGSTQGGFVVTVTGVGFVPGQTTVGICDIQLPPASVQVNAQGNSLTFTAPPCTAAQTQLLVTTPTGAASTVFVYQTEEPLPDTGSSISLLLMASAALTVTGGFALLLVRRRSPRPSH